MDASNTAVYCIPCLTVYLCCLLHYCLYPHHQPPLPPAPAHTKKIALDIERGGGGRDEGYSSLSSPSSRRYLGRRSWTCRIPRGPEDSRWGETTRGGSVPLLLPEPTPCTPSTFFFIRATKELKRKKDVCVLLLWVVGLNHACFANRAGPVRVLQIS